MMKNISSRERVIRIILGIVIIGWGIYAKSWWGIIGVLPLATGLIGFCALYQFMKSGCPCCSKKKEA